MELRLVYYDGKFYTSSANVETKHWCRNLLKTPAVEVHVRSGRYLWRARQVEDERLRRRILELRDSPALTDRVVFELAPHSAIRS